MYVHSCRQNNLSPILNTVDRELFICNRIQLHTSFTILAPLKGQFHEIFELKSFLQNSSISSEQREFAKIFATYRDSALSETTLCQFLL